MKNRARSSVPVGRALVPLAAPRVPPQPKKAEPFYLSREWRDLVAKLILQRGRKCERCGAFRNDEGEPIRVFGDHIIELKDGGALLDEGNVRILCSKCHSAKTAQARARRSRAQYGRMK
jgi:5-methylcytosine-specific restriction enzyme A